ncbi:hypothetical protein GCM10007884_47390 [Methylobacterium brachythecii]|uniref:Transposase DDE domain-containing protein n=1 Tax=Methylobacterium brachythecii TaxID=1176177 RepID=A0ABQ6D9X8_9HYPH|nr:hypothetical protein GCM10007884_47390 [Methylobacterium brachythecii]
MAMTIHYGAKRGLKLLRPVRVRSNEGSVVEIVRWVAGRLFAIRLRLVLDRFAALVFRLTDRLVRVGLVGQSGHHALRFAEQRSARWKGAVACRGMVTLLTRGAKAAGIEEREG